MSTQQQPIAAIASKVVPFRAIADDADYVIVQPGTILPTPTFQVIFGKLIPEVPAVPAVPPVPQRSGPNLPDYVPAQPGKPEIPAVPAQFIPHRAETLTLTEDEWKAWDGTVSDNDYVLSIVAKRYGQSLVPQTNPAS